MKYKHNNEWKELYLKPAGDTLPIGSITQYAGSIAPTNWLICDGSEVSRETYKNLFNAIGTTYGEGDGSTTFNLPDLRGKVGVGLSSDTEFNELGKTGGEKTHTLTKDEMPSHTHNLGKWYNTQDGGNGARGSNATGTVVDNANGIAASGGNQPHNILQPYLVTNYIIKYDNSIGLVGSVTSDINDENEMAAINAKAVKDYVDNVPDIVLDGPEVKMNYKVDGKDVYAKKFTLGNGTEAGKQKSFNLTNFGFTVGNHNKIRYECVNNFGCQLPNITADEWSQYGWLNSETVYKIRNGSLIDTSNDILYLTIYYTKTTD